MKIIVGKTDLETVNPQLAKEWDYEANGDLTPKDVTDGSNKKVGWICEKGHKWTARVGDRTIGKGCPYCSGRRPIVGETDLATVNPQLASEWDYETNGDLTPKDVTAGSQKKVGWVCSKGHRWIAAIANRTNGNGCPYCSGRVRRPIIVGETDLATVNPQLASEWDYETNGDLTPKDVTTGSQKKVGWICTKGHRWTAVISSRTRGAGCPYCSGRVRRPIIVGETDLATVNPQLASEWDYETNGDLTPKDVTTGSQKKVGWICTKGHRWTAVISSRTRGAGCPYCSGRRPIVGETDLAAVNPQLASEWDYETNGDLTPVDVTAGSNKKVGWICTEGHKWTAKISSRTIGGTGCPYCNCSGRGRRPIIAGETDLATVNPQLASEWDYDTNGDLTPKDVTAGSKKKVGWICEKGHKWTAVVCDRTIGKGCPYCSGRRPIVGETDLATVNPQLASEWDYEANGNLTPADVTAGSGKKVGWICEKGHRWTATIVQRKYIRKNGSDCPYCRKGR